MAHPAPLALASILVALLCCAGCVSDGQDGAQPSRLSFPYGVEGNRAVRSQVLLAAARTELKAFEAVSHNPADLDDAAYSMQRELWHLGHAHGKVTVRMEPSPQKIESVTFVIDEGPKTRWGTLAFSGVSAFDEARLRRFIVEEPARKGPLSPREDLPPFRETDLDAGVARIEAFYLGQGYYRVKAGPPKISWTADLATADVEIPIQENRRYLVRKIEIEVTDPTMTTAVICTVCGGFEGQPYHAVVPSRVALAVRESLACAGHALMNVESSGRVDDETASAVIDVKVSPGPRVRMSGTQVSGNTRTRESFVREQARLEPGRTMTGRSLECAIESLYRTGLFKSVRVEPIVEAGTESRPAIEEYEASVGIAVEELLSRTIDLEAGWGSYELARVSVRYRDRNLLGLGRDFEVEPAASLKSAGADVRLFDRYLLGRDNTIELLSGVLLREEPSFDLRTFRSEAAVRRRFSEALTGRLGYRFVLSNASNVAVEDPEERDNTVTSEPFVTLQYDHRDSPVLPTKGVFADVSASWSASALGANLDFIDLQAGGSAYHRLGEYLVLAAAVRGRTRQPIDGRDTLPIQERLFLGGATSVRSFYEDELGPSEGTDPIGGLTSVNATIELRQRLAGDLYGAVFYDVGSIGERPFDLDGFGHAIGCGLRYYLPFGPLRLDVGFNPGRRFASDSDFAVHFSFGFTF